MKTIITRNIGRNINLLVLFCTLAGLSAAVAVTSPTRAENAKPTQSASVPADQLRCTGETVPTVVRGLDGSELRLKVPLPYWSHLQEQKESGPLIFGGSHLPPLTFSFPTAQGTKPNCLPHGGMYLPSLGAIGIVVPPDADSFDRMIKDFITKTEPEPDSEGQFHVFCARKGQSCFSRVFISDPNALPWRLVVTCNTKKFTNPSETLCTAYQSYSPRVTVIYGITDAKLLANLQDVDRDIGEFMDSLSPDTSDLEKNKNNKEGKP